MKPEEASSCSFSIFLVVRSFVYMNLDIGSLTFDVMVAFFDPCVSLPEQKLAPLNHVFRLKDKWFQRSLQLEGVNFLQLSNDDLTATCSTSFSFFNEGGHGAHFENAGTSNSNSNVSRKNPFNGRRWTNILLAANVL